MIKINDRLILGAVSGLLANIPKLLIGKVAMKFKIAEINGPEIAAGMFIPPHKLAMPAGRAVGYVADSVIAAILGIVTVYILSVTGKDKYALKGLFSGQVMWQTLYGLMGNFGASKVRAYAPATVLNEVLAHTLFGLTAAAIAANLGDEKLFTSKTPSNTGLSEQSGNTQSTQPAQPKSHLPQQ